MIAASAPPDARRVPRLLWQARAGAGAVAAGERLLPEETAIAFVYEGVSHAVMMATPRDLEDFAVGFSLTEGIIDSAEDIADLLVVPGDGGVLLRLSLARRRADLFWERRRHVAGPSGCGLCGIESLSEALRPSPVVASDLRIDAGEISAAMAALVREQSLNRATRAVHAAGFWRPGRGIDCVREDLGRHNALDKLAGALARERRHAGTGAILLTSRISLELVQKAAMIGAPILIAISAPSALAIRVAEAAGITVVGIARSDSCEIFTHPDRVRQRPCVAPA